MFLAHLMNSGFGPFYDGLLHLFLTPEELLPVVALSLLAGMRGPRFGRVVLFALPSAWLLGSLAGRRVPAHAALPWIAAVLTLALGALVAADRNLPYFSVALLAAGLGLWNGVGNGMELAQSDSATFVTGLGTASGVFVVVALLAALSSSVRVPWAKIAVRVAGSWIAASGLFMLGWSLRRA